MLLLLFKLMALLTLRLLAATRCATWTTECTCGTAATSAASATAEAAWATWTAWSTLATPTAAAATAATVGGLRRHGCRVWMRRHHGRRWTTTAALPLTLVALALARASAALAAAVIAWLTARTLPLGAARTWSWTAALATTRGERVVGHAAGAARLRHGARHSVAWVWTFCARLRGRLRSGLVRAVCLWLLATLRARLSSTWLRGAWLGSGLLLCLCGSGILCGRLCTWLGSSRLRGAWLRCAWLWRVSCRLFCLGSACSLS